MPARTLHFLLVEDDLAHAELVQLGLEENRVCNAVHHVSDGAAALDFLFARPPHERRILPDVVLLDLKLPKKDGHEVLAAIKADPVLRQIPVVVLTTSQAEADRTRAYDHHANSYVCKPVDFEKFHKMIKDLGLYWAVWNEPPVLPARAPTAAPSA